MVLAGISRDWSHPALSFLLSSLTPPHGGLITTITNPTASNQGGAAYQDISHDLRHCTLQSMAGNAPDNSEQTPTAPNSQLPSQADGPNMPLEHDSRMPTRKDASLREFLSKMDDYAPIVCESPWGSPLSTNNACADPRRSNPLLHDKGGPPSTTAHRSTARATPCPCNPKVHIRHRGRRISIQPYSGLVHDE